MHRKNKNIVLFFAISWSALLIICLLFIAIWVQNVRLQNKLFISEQTLKGLNDDVQKFTSEKNQQEEGALDYLEWKYVLKDQVSGAKQRLSKQINSIKDLKKNKELASLLYYNLGLTYTLAVDFNSAIKAFEEAISINSKDADSYYNLGLLYSTYRQKPGKAVSYYKKYLEFVPVKSATAGEVKERIKLLER